MCGECLQTVISSRPDRRRWGLEQSVLSSLYSTLPYYSSILYLRCAKRVAILSSVPLRSNESLASGCVCGLTSHKQTCLPRDLHCRVITSCIPPADTVLPPLCPVTVSPTTQNNHDSHKRPGKLLSMVLKQQERLRFNPVCGIGG